MDVDDFHTVPHGVSPCQRQSALSASPSTHPPGENILLKSVFPRPRPPGELGHALFLRSAFFSTVRFAPLTVLKKRLTPEKSIPQHPSGLTLPPKRPSQKRKRSGKKNRSPRSAKAKHTPFGDSGQLFSGVRRFFSTVRRTKCAVLKNAERRKTAAPCPRTGPATKTEKKIKKRNKSA